MSDAELPLGHPAKNDSKQRRKKSNQQRLSLHSNKDYSHRHGHATPAISFDSETIFMGNQ